MCKKLIYLTSFVLMLGLILTRAADAADPSLVGWWRFDEGSGTIAYDSSGNGNDGTFNGDPQWVVGYFGGALEFDGSDDWLDCGSDPSLDLTKWTITFWLKINENKNYSAFIIKEGCCEGIAENYEVLAYEDGHFHFPITFTDGSRTYVNTSAGVCVVGEWAHFAYSYDAAEGRRFYKNGSLIFEDAESGTPQTTTESLSIGNEQLLSRFVNGTMDDIRIYNHALTQEEIQGVMIGMPPELASNPSPANEATDVPREVVLSWEPGEFAAPTNGHKVYFGESFDDVNDATGGVAQSANSYTLPERLDFGTTYYWRVDEVDAALESTIFRGDVWSFTTEPVAYAIENVTATASSSNSPDEGPGNTISGSGLDADDLHSMEAPDMWLSSSEPLGAWIGYEFDKVYKLHQMWVWNSNQRTEPIVGFGFKDVTIEYSADGTDWRELGGVPEFARAPGADGYAYNTIVDLGDVVAKYVKITANSNWGGIVSQYGLSEVRFFYIPVHAREPNPDFGATDVSIGTIDEPIDVTLGFRAGREAAKHDVYFSSEEQAVTDGTVPVTTVTEASYGPLPLDIGQTYYWRVDEVNEAEIPAMWQGDIWDFTTQEYFVVEDFEDYNDWPGYEIYTTWIDGYGVPTNGSEVAYPLPDFEAGEHYVETKIVHDGGQSAPFFYNNTAGVTYSEAKCIFDAPRDWTIRGIGSLSLWFRGYPAFVGSFVEEPAGSYTMTAYGADIWDQADEFHFAYQQLSGAGAIIAKVESLEQTHNWAKAGVMIRDTLDPNSAHAMMIVTPTQGLTFERRTSASQSTSRTRQAGITAPQWVKVERDIYGNVIASYSSDGNTWTELGGDVITMNTPMYIGLALTAHNAGAACEAKFSNVSTTGTVGAQWTNQDIGILSNDAAPMYVTLNGIATVYHDDPAVTQIDEWTPWPIDLQDFAAKGVDLTNVNTITIGFGDKNAPQTASGLVFFDDIRLYPLP